MYRANIKSNIIKNLFTGSYFVNNTYYGLNTTSKDKCNFKLIRDYKNEFLIVTIWNIAKGEELSMNYNEMFDHLKLKLIKGSTISNETDIIFFKYIKDAVKGLINTWKNKNFP